MNVERQVTLALERMDMLAAQALSLHNRADALDRVANELRTEAAACSAQLLEVRQALVRANVRRRVRARIAQRYCGAQPARKSA